jgi:hypothetical protein
MSPTPATVVPFRLGGYRFKQAESDAEFQQVHRLNHAVFADEVAQHPRTPTGALIDKFHHKNVYFIALEKEELVGLVAVHSQPPFSIAERLADATLLDRLGGPLLEVRLLAVTSRARYGTVAAGLIGMVHAHAERHGCDHVLISGIRERVATYTRYGFRPLGPEVASGRAWYTPMALQISRLEPRARDFVARLRGLMREGQT